MNICAHRTIVIHRALRRYGDTMRTTILSIFAVGLFGCAQPAPQRFDDPVIFIGSLQSETLFAKQIACQSSSEEGSDTSGSEMPLRSVCVSGNSCGRGEAELYVHEVVAGSFDGSLGVLRYSIGEWCQPRFFSSRGRLLVCVYNTTGGEHRFRSEPVYETESGEVVLLRSIKQIGHIDLTTLLEPLPRGIWYGDVSEFTDDELADLMETGFAIIDGETVSAVQGVYVADLAESLSEDSWSPRRVAVLVPDGLGGYVDVSNSERPYADAGTPPVESEEESERAIEVWDC